MKEKIAVFLLILQINNAIAQQTKKPIPYDTVNVNLLSLNYRVFEASLGFEMKYFYFKNRSGFAPTGSLGYVNYNNETIIKNATYNVNGGFCKIGIVNYQKFSGVVIYAGINSVFSYSRQNITSSFNDKVWGTYNEKFITNDFNIGLELGLGVIVKVYKKIFLNFEGTFGNKLLKQNNPLYKNLNVSNEDASSLPYFSPGMGRGGAMFINASLGLGYQF